MKKLTLLNWEAGEKKKLWRLPSERSLSQRW